MAGLLRQAPARMVTGKGTSRGTFLMHVYLCQVSNTNYQTPHREGLRENIQDKALLELTCRVAIVQTCPTMREVRDIFLTLQSAWAEERHHLQAQIMQLTSALAGQPSKGMLPCVFWHEITSCVMQALHIRSNVTPSIPVLTAGVACTAAKHKLC